MHRSIRKLHLSLLTNEEQELTLNEGKEALKTHSALFGLQAHEIRMLLNGHLQRNLIERLKLGQIASRRKYDKHIIE